jgi:hypothetical protein
MEKGSSNPDSEPGGVNGTNSVAVPEFRDSRIPIMIVTIKPSGPSVAPTSITVRRGKPKNEPTTTDNPIHPRIQTNVNPKIAM